jgi:hypothetical protein
VLGESSPGGDALRLLPCVSFAHAFYLAADWVGGIRAPMIQKRGMKIPMMNMIQCPFRIDMIPRVISRITYRRPKRPIDTPETASSISPSNGLDGVAGEAIA